MSIQSDSKRKHIQSIDPHKLPGLMMPAFILKCLEAGLSEEEIAKMFPEDGQLIKMWIAFLLHSHWATKDFADGGYRWGITAKGIEWISKYNFD